MVGKAKHPAISKFPAYADQIIKLMDSDENFCSICRDYEQIICEIASTESKTSRIDGRLRVLLELRSDLENDIFNFLEKT